MKLYLSSYRAPVTEELFGLLKQKPTDCTVAIVPNAKDYKLPEERAQSLDELILYLGGWGFRSDVIDLREYDQPEVLREVLETYDMVWVAGGNSFMLREEMQRGGFDTIIEQVLSSGVVYVGESAGAIVAGTSLEGSEIADDPELADEVITSGLSLVDKIIVPHADNPDYVEYSNAMKKRHGNDENVLYINDNQAYVVNDTQQKIVSES